MDFNMHTFSDTEFDMNVHVDDDGDDEDNEEEELNEYEFGSINALSADAGIRLSPGADHEAHDSADAGQRPDALSNYLGACVSASASASASLSTAKATFNKASSLKSWRTRDPIYELCQKRQQLEQKFLPPQHRSSSGDHDRNAYYGGERSRAVPKGGIFNIEAALHECKNNPEKRQMIHRAFDAAAFSVLRALQKQRLLAEEKQKSEEEFKARTGAGALSLSTRIGFLQTLDELGQAKMDALEIVSNKRKVPTSSSTGTRTLPSSSSSAKRAKGSGGKSKSHGKSKDSKTKNEQDMVNKQKVSSTSLPADGKNSNSNSNSNSDVVPAVQLAGYSNLDSRSTVSRAILCAAASLAFKQLTPNFSGEEGENMDINPLNVPQNPNPENTNANSGTHGSIKKENNPGTSISLENPFGESKSADPTSHTTQDLKDGDKKKPEINMGAVIMSAEIFAKRSIEQVKSAVQRSERRRKWRMDCARAELMSKQKKLGLSTINTSVNAMATTSELKRENSIAPPCTHAINPLDEYLTWKNLGAVVTDNEDEIEREREREREHERNNTANAMDMDDSSDDNVYIHSHMGASYVPETKSEEWTMRCLPRLLDVMHKGPGNVIYHDMKWASRSDRIIQLIHGIALDERFQNFGSDGSGGDDDDEHEDEDEDENALEKQGGYANYGPHLIITTDHDLDKFMQVLRPLGSLCSPFLKGLLYNGSTSQRRKKRMEHFTSIGLSGFSSSPYNVIVTSYRIFIQDYLHFCHIPFQAVVLDDGMSWLGTAHFDPNGKLGKVFDIAMWSKSDMHIGLAGVLDKKWDFSMDIASDGTLDRKGADTSIVTGAVEVNVKGKDHSTSAPKLLGLTARYKILVASKMHSVYRDTVYPAPASSLLSFFIPQFADAVKEEWDRSRIHACEKSMDHVRLLVSRGVIVFRGYDDDDEDATDGLFSLAMAAMTGDKSNDAIEDGTSLENIYPEVVSSEKTLSLSTDKMISNGKIVQSRRLAASWLTNGSPIRYELGTVSLDPIMNIIRQTRSKNGFICAEIVPASSILSVGNGCTVVGPSAFKTALRCGRIFANEQGLRQHIAAMHAPPGTWLCRNCAIDCGTSLARTQHERSCTANGSGNTKEHPNGGVVTTVGQKSKKQNSDNGNSSMTDKDEDGCYRVPGYRGVWVDPKGKHFIKIDGKPYSHDQNSDPESESNLKRVFYDSSEQAAQTYDTIIRRNGIEDIAEMNYKSDGSRIKYDEVTTATSVGRGLEMLGGGASSVVPALSVINIKDLPEGVVPLLRDPRQTSRAGGNSKRYIYAYRGVCRQARKGHDRWQSQISFSGTNHYLGTFDSEWDAAAIYAWAHLILYGEEATKKAQKEGEDAVAAYEQEKKDIAAGKVVAPPAKKKKATPTKPKGSGQRGRRKKSEGGQSSPITTDLMKGSIAKKMSPEFQGSQVLEDDSVLLRIVSERILASRSKVENECIKCISVGKTQNSLQSGCALLVGLSSTDAEWSVEDFFTSTYDLLGPEKEIFLPAMRSECSLSLRFRSLLKGIPCFIGKASLTLEHAMVSLGFYGSELGGTIGRVDCNIGGIGWSCNEVSVCVSYFPEGNIFHFTVCDENDIVTLNGFRIKASMGSVVIRSGDVCSVGSRVFLFLLPSDELV